MTDTQRTREVYGGLYSDRDSAERGIRRFHEAGYPPEHIGVVGRHDDAAKLADDTGSDMAAGATTGAVTGGMLGGLAGLLVGIGALAIPGIGPVVAGGALASAFGVTGGTALAGAGIGAATGGIIGALTGLGFSEEEATYYDRGVRDGRYLVTVRDQQGRAEGYFDETGADYYRPGRTGTSTTTNINQR